MDELIVTYFVYSPDSQTLPIRIFGEVKRGLNPTLNAISTIFILATAVLVVAAEWLRVRAK
jgi:spermidine/putrescine transport system permease protein